MLGSLLLLHSQASNQLGCPLKVTFRKTDIQGQTRDVLAQIDRHLQEAGSDKTRLLRVEIFLANIADIGAMNVVWDQWVSAGNAPPRATVEAKLANPAYKIEVVATAAVKA